MKPFIDSDVAGQFAQIYGYQRYQDREWRNISNAAASFAVFVGLSALSWYHTPVMAPLQWLARLQIMLAQGDGPRQGLTCPVRVMEVTDVDMPAFVGSRAPPGLLLVVEESMRDEALQAIISCLLSDVYVWDPGEVEMVAQELVVAD